MPTAWDVRAFGLALGLSLLLFGIACGITGATDEGSVSWAVRIARTLAAAPACSAAATFVVLRRASRRGEMLALASIGASPARSAAGVVAGAIALSVAAALVVAVDAEATATFFPRPPSVETIRHEGTAFVDDARGVRIEADGELGVAPRSTLAARMPPRGRALSAALVVAMFGVALALGAASRVDWRAAGLGFAAFASCVFLLQAAAAGRVPVPIACLPALALLIAASVRYRAPVW